MYLIMTYNERKFKNSKNSRHVSKTFLLDLSFSASNYKINANYHSYQKKITSYPKNTISIAYQEMNFEVHL